MAAEPPVTYEIAERIATLTLNRPDRLNAMTPDMSALYSSLLDRAAADEEVRAIILTGRGRGFCAGSDTGRLEAIAGAGGVPASVGRHTLRRCSEIPKPVIAAINGACAGLGLVLALECDVRFAAQGAKLTTAFVRRGLPAEYALSWILPRTIGLGRALDLLLSGRAILAEEARDLGLVNWVVPAEELHERARAYARDLVESCSPLAMATIKWQVRRHLDREYPAANEDSRLVAERALGSPDFKEGVASFAERRQARFPAMRQPYLHEGL